MPARIDHDHRVRHGVQHRLQMGFAFLQLDLGAFWLRVMSRATFEAPTRTPSLSQTGDIVTETSMISPSLRRRRVSK